MTTEDAQKVAVTIINAIRAEKLCVLNGLIKWRVTMYDELLKRLDASRAAWNNAMPEPTDLEKEAAAAIRDLQAKLDAVKPRPIEEAPRDGSEILAFADDPHVAGRRYSGVATWAFANPDFPTTEDGWFWPYAIRPTHFIPLSALTALATQEQKT